MWRRRADARWSACGGQRQRLKAKAALGFCGLGGAVWVGRTRRKPRSAVRPSRWRLCVRALAKQCFASKAPSPLGARWRHPWRQRSCQPTPPHPRQFPGDGGKEHWVTDELMDNKKDAAFAASFLFGPAVLSVERSHAPIQASEARDPLLLFLLSPVAGGHRKLSEGGRVGFAGVSAAWMRRPSLQGWIHGVSREPNPPDPARLLL